MSNDNAWWGKTRSLAIAVLAVWLVFAFGIHAFVGRLNDIVFLDFPLGFYLAAQGSPIVFVALIFWFARRQDTIDRQHNVAEPD